MACRDGTAMSKTFGGGSADECNSLSNVHNVSASDLISLRYKQKAFIILNTCSIDGRSIKKC